MAFAPSSASPNATAFPTPPAPHLADRAGLGGSEGCAPGCDEAGVVGVEPAWTVRPEQHRIHRSHRADDGALDLDPGRRRFLVGVGDVDPVVVPGRAPLEQLVEPDAELGRNQQVVGDLDAPHAARERVQPRGLRGGDVVADESEASLRHEPFPLAACLRIPGPPRECRRLPRSTRRRIASPRRRRRSESGLRWPCGRFAGATRDFVSNEGGRPGRAGGPRKPGAGRDVGEAVQ